MIPELIKKLLRAEPADPKALEEALHKIMMGEVTAPLTAGLLVALRVREPERSRSWCRARDTPSHR